MASVLREHLDPVMKKLDDIITRMDNQAEGQEENQKKMEENLDDLKKDMFTLKIDFLHFNRPSKLNSLHHLLQRCITTSPILRLCWIEKFTDHFLE